MCETLVLVCAGEEAEEKLLEILETVEKTSMDRELCHPFLPGLHGVPSADSCYRVCAETNKNVEQSVFYH